MIGRELVLTEDQARLMERLVASGRYGDATDVLGEGLRLLAERADDEDRQVEALRAAVQTGLDDLAAGRFRTFDTPEALDTHMAALTERALARTGSGS